MRHESLERYRLKKRRRMFSNAKTIRYEKRKVNADRRQVLRLCFCALYGTLNACLKPP